MFQIAFENDSDNLKRKCSKLQEIGIMTPVQKQCYDLIIKNLQDLKKSQLGI